jgi:hypothetical protein
VDESSFGADGHAFGAVENPFSADASLICYYFVFLPIPTDQKKKTPLNCNRKFKGGKNIIRND